MLKLLRGEGWVELIFAAIAISLIGIWLVTIVSTRLSSMTLWESWQSQRPAASTETVAKTTSTGADVVTADTLAVR